MNEDWFKKVPVIGVVPTNLMGCLTLFLMIFSFLIFAIGYIYFSGKNEILSCLSAILGMGSVAAGYAIAYWKRSDR